MPRFSPLRRAALRVICFAVAPLALPAAVPGELLWSFNVNTDLYSTPAVSASGAIFVGTSKASSDTGANRVVSLMPGATSATQRWSYTGTITDWVDSSPALNADGTTAFVGCWNNTLYALNTANGALRWSFTTSSYISSSPAVAADGSVYVTSGDGSLYALNPAALTALGRLKWSYLADGIIESSPAIGPDGSVVFGTLGGSVTSLNATGTLKWTITLPVVGTRDSRIKASPAIAPDGTVYIGSGNYFFYALDAATGAIKWTFEALAEVDSSAAVGPTGAIYFASRAGEFYAIDDDGILLWGQALGDIYVSSPAIDAAGNIYIPAFAGNNTSTLHAFTPAGATLWATTLPTVIDSSPVITTDGKLLIGGYDNKLYALHTGIGPATEGWGKFRRSLDNAARVPPGIAPTVTLSPASQVALVGQPITFTTAASGTSPLTYIWRRNGVALTDTLDTTLARKAITATDAGTYDVLVVNAFGSATTATVALTVGDTITPNPSGGGPLWTIHRPTIAATSALIEQSPDLATWSTLGVTTAFISSTNGVETFTATAPLSASGRVFLRLRQATP